MNYKTTTLILTTFMLFAGCSDSQTQKNETQEPAKIEKALKIIKVEEVKTQQVIVKKDYTIEEIYNSMCVECHSPDGTGNTEKLTPSMAGLSQEEMKDALLEVENDDGHVIMEHNRGQILKMGMEYGAKDMAKYMFEKFNK